MDKGTWRVTVHRTSKSCTWLSNHEPKHYQGSVTPTSPPSLEARPPPSPSPIIGEPGHLLCPWACEYVTSGLKQHDIPERLPRLSPAQCGQLVLGPTSTPSLSLVLTVPIHAIASSHGHLQVCSSEPGAWELPGSDCLQEWLCVMTHRIWRINTAASLSLEWDDAGRVLVSSHDLLAASDSLKHFTLISFRSPSHFFMAR